MGSVTRIKRRETVYHTLLSTIPLVERLLFVHLFLQIHVLACYVASNKTLLVVILARFQSQNSDNRSGEIAI